MTKKQTERLARLMPGGKPRWVRVYDNHGETADRYTVVYTGLYNNQKCLSKTSFKRRSHYYRVMSHNPCHPQGVGIFCESDIVVDEEAGRWGGTPMGRVHRALGTRIPFEEMSQEAQNLAIADYKEIWNLN